MRFVVFGAGAIGGVVGGRLIQHGHEVALVARGEHGSAIADHGLRIDAADGSTVVRPTTVVDRAAAIEWRPDDVVLLAVKSQSTLAAVCALSESAPSSVSVACLQNGVANEQTVLRWFPRVFGVSVMCPAAHLQPGIVVAYSSPITALLDIGRYPNGADEIAEAISASFDAAGMDSLVRADIMRWKYAKLVLLNLSNAVDALCGPGARGGELARLIRDEGFAVLEAAGIEFASADEDRARRGSLLQITEVGGWSRTGSSSWQSLARGTGSIETDYLNGEIVLLARLHHMPAPANELVQRLAGTAARERWAPGSLSEEELLRRLQKSAQRQQR